MKPLLSIDTSVPVARVAVLDADGTVRAHSEKAAARHSSNLLRLCDDVLRASGLRVADLGAIACGAGPGSFTGLRVGFAVAKGLAFPTDCPLLLISSLQALAQDLGGAPGQRVVPVIDAGKGQVYARLHRASDGRGAPEPLDDELTLTPDALVARLAASPDVGETLVGGAGVDRHLEIFRAGLPAACVRVQVAGPSAVSVGRLALQRLQRGERDDLAHAVPVYGRPPDITHPKRDRPRPL